MRMRVYFKKASSFMIGQNFIPHHPKKKSCLDVRVKWKNSLSGIIIPSPLGDEGIYHFKSI